MTLCRVRTGCTYVCIRHQVHLRFLEKSENSGDVSRLPSLVLVLVQTSCFTLAMVPLSDGTEALPAGFYAREVPGPVPAKLPSLSVGQCHHLCSRLGQSRLPKFRYICAVAGRNSPHVLRYFLVSSFIPRIAVRSEIVLPRLLRALSLHRLQTGLEQDSGEKNALVNSCSSFGLGRLWLSSPQHCLQRQNPGYPWVSLHNHKQTHPSHLCQPG